MKDCLFCKIVSGEVPSFKIWETVYTYAFLDAFPNSEGHTLVIPKKHFDDYQSCDDFYLKEVAKTKKEVAKLLTEKLPLKGINYVSNQGPEAFQVIFHYHEHVIPKYTKEIGFFIKNNVDKSNIRDNEEIRKIIRSGLD